MQGNKIQATSAIPVTDDPEAGQPWYRQPWMWLVVGLPLASVFAGIAMITLSIVYRDDLVRDDWYRAGRSINQDLQAEQHARQLDLKGTLVLEPATPAIDVTLSAGDAATLAALPAQLQLSLAHSTLASEDMQVILTRQGGDRWYGVLPRLPMGKRQLMLEPLASVAVDSRWRLRADVTFQGAPVALLPAL